MKDKDLASGRRIVVELLDEEIIERKKGESEHTNEEWRLAWVLGCPLVRVRSAWLGSEVFRDSTNCDRWCWGKTFSRKSTVTVNTMVTW